MPGTDYDIAVVGAGIIGLATAREFKRRRPSLTLTVLEREQRIGLHQTGRNSGVVHAGIYYAPGSLKARLCVEGARDMYELCERHAVPHERCGKLIVARDGSELPRLDELERRGRERRARPAAAVGRRAARGGASRAWRGGTALAGERDRGLPGGGPGP